MFRCCLPCRGGSKAPATSLPNTPVADQNHHHQPLVSVYEGNGAGTGVVLTAGVTAQHQLPLPLKSSSSEAEVRKTIINSTDLAEEEEEDSDEEESIISVPPTVVQRIQCQSNQQSPLPHIAEEEEVIVGLCSGDPQATAHKTSSSSSNNSGNPSDRELVSKLLDHRYVVPEDFSSPSPPRTKHSASAGQRGKQHQQQPKGRTRSVTSTTSSETITSGNGGGSKSDSVNNSNSASQQPSSGFLLPKMQAEQGSIGELQKYHSRYLKNRRHTLANVR